ncbi:MAG: hypothetical protein PF689_04695 [Deltaproteobacteria bacterium]|jgi:hypothetical protein|nr:hypothetical protein [Deltaproteobacteria bacterium]
MAKNSSIKIKILSTPQRHKVTNTIEKLLAGMELEISARTRSLKKPGRADFHLGIVVPTLEEIDMLDEFARAQNQKNRKLIPVLPPDVTLPAVVKLLGNDNIDQIILEKFNWKNDLRTIIGILCTGDIFGMEKYLSDEDEVFYLRFHDYKGRQYVLDKIQTVAKDMKLRRMRREHAVQAGEEMIMNALYNAPRKEDGTMMFGSIDPHKRVNMDSPKPVSLRYSQTDEGLFMSVRDRFGALDKKTTLEYLNKCIHSDEQIDRKTIGAGLGIFLTVSRVQKYIVNVAPTIATEVIVNLRQIREFGVPCTIAFFTHGGTK